MDTFFDLQMDFTDETKFSLPNYKIIRELGRGGMGIVLLAQHKRLQNFVAIKLFRGQSQKRFSREGQALAALNHPNIVRIYEMAKDGSYFVMEHVVGATLSDLLQNDQLPRKQVIKIFMQICTAMDYAHEHGVVHRDLKPANIMIQHETMQVKIMDFGIVKLDLNQGEKLSATGEVIGTISYMSPEQIKCSQHATKLSDIYSIGIMLYEYLAGTLPFCKGSQYQIVHQILHSPPPPLRKSTLARICIKCIEKDPAKRYQNCQILHKVLQNLLLKKRPVKLKKSPTTPKKVSQNFYHKLYINMCVFAIVLMAIFLIIFPPTNLVIEDEQGNKYTFSDDQQSRGKSIFINGDIYEGQFQDMKPHGKGTMRHKNGDIYSGNFIRGKFHGNGEIIYKNNDKYIGEFANGVYQGTGRFEYADGGKYLGKFAKNKKHGTGLYINPKGEVILDGMWRNDKCIQTKRTSSTPSISKSFFVIINNTPFALTVFWVDYDTKLRAYGNILTGQKFVQSSFIGHSWEVYAEGKPIATFSISTQEQQWIIEHNDLYRSWLQRKK